MFQLCSRKEGFPGLAKVLGVHRFHIIGFWLVDERVPSGTLSYYEFKGSWIRSGSLPHRAEGFKNMNLKDGLCLAMMRDFCEIKSNCIESQCFFMRLVQIREFG